MMGLMDRIGRRLFPDEPEDAPPREDTEQKLREAEEKLRETERLGAEVQRVASESRQIRRENRFAQRIRAATGRATG